MFVSYDSLATEKTSNLGLTCCNVTCRSAEFMDGVVRSVVHFRPPKFHCQILDAVRDVGRQGIWIRLVDILPRHCCSISPLLWELCIRSD